MVPRQVTGRVKFAQTFLALFGSILLELAYAGGASQALGASKILEVSRDMRSVTLKENAEFFYDREGIAERKRYSELPFTEEEDGILLPGIQTRYYIDHVLYLRVKIFNPEAESVSVVIEQRDRFLGPVSVYLVENDQDRHLGSSDGVDQLKSSSQFVSVAVPPGEQTIIIRMIGSRGGIQLGIHSLATATSIAAIQTFAGGIVYGGLCILIVSALFIYLRLQHKAYLWYAFYALFYGITSSTVSSHFPQLLALYGLDLTVAARVASLISNIVGHITLGMGLLFIRQYLSIPETHFKLSKILFVTGVCCFVLAFLIGVFLTSSIAARMEDRGLGIALLCSRHIGMLGALSLFAVAVYFAFKKRRAAFFLTVSWVVLIGFTLYWIGGMEAAITNHPLRQMAGGAGVLLEMIILSLGLGDSIREELDDENRKISALSHTLQDLNEGLEQKVKERTYEVTSILNAVQEGIMPIIQVGNSDHSVDQNYSVALRGILEPQSEKHQDWLLEFLQRSSLSEEEKSLISTVLATSLAEDVMQFEVNVHNLPKECRLRTASGEKIISMDWRAVLYDDKHVHTILLVMRDETLARMLKFEAEEKTMALEVLMTSATITARDFEVFGTDGERFMETIARLKITTETSSKEPLRTLHSFKGLSRNYGFTKLSSLIHALEAVLLEKQAAEAVLHAYDALRSEWQLILEVNQRYLLRTISISSGAEGAGLLLPDILSRELLGVSSIATELSKPVPTISFSGEDILFPTTWQPLLREVFTHLLRNAIDHGIEDPEERRAAGKSLAGRISIGLTINMPWAEIRLFDDGGGVPFEKLYQHAKKKGIEIKESLCPLEKASLMFASGLSSRDQVSEISGRGVGMDAVKAIIEQAGGKISLLAAGAIRSDRIAIVFLMQLPIWGTVSSRE